MIPFFVGPTPSCYCSALHARMDCPTHGLLTAKCIVRDAEWRELTDELSPNEWEQITGIKITRPNGWIITFKTPNKEYKPKGWNVPIDRTEFHARMLRSSVGPMFRHDPNWRRPSWRMIPEVKLAMEVIASRSLPEGKQKPQFTKGIDPITGLELEDESGEVFYFVQPFGSDAPIISSIRPFETSPITKKLIEQFKVNNPTIEQKKPELPMRHKAIDIKREDDTPPALGNKS